MPKTTALAPMASANVTTAAKVKPRGFAQHADSEPHILHQRFKEMTTHGLVAFLFESLTGSKLDASLSLCLSAVNAGAFQIVCPILDVRAKLLFHIFGNLGTMKESGGKGAKVGGEIHISSGRAARAAVMAVDSRFQPSVSSRNRLRPAAVSS